MSNEETLQEYNERLEENNTSLTNVLTTIKNLPSSSGGGTSDIYSTVEQRIGTWIDGKPLYRTVVVLQKENFPNQNTVYVGHNIPNIDVIVTQKCNWYDNQSKRWRAIPSNYYSTLDWATQISSDPGGIMFELGNSASLRINQNASVIHVTLEYTKTTD